MNIFNINITTINRNTHLSNYYQQFNDYKPTLQQSLNSLFHNLTNIITNIDTDDAIRKLDLLQSINDKNHYTNLLNDEQLYIYTHPNHDYYINQSNHIEIVIELDHYTIIGNISDITAKISNVHGEALLTEFSNRSAQNKSLSEYPNFTFENFSMNINDQKLVPHIADKIRDVLDESQTKHITVSIDENIVVSFDVTYTVKTKDDFDKLLNSDFFTINILRILNNKNIHAPKDYVYSKLSNLLLSTNRELTYENYSMMVKDNQFYLFKNNTNTAISEQIAMFTTY